MKYGIAGGFALKIIGEPIKHSFVAYYIDSSASAEPREALRKLFTGPSFAAMGQAAELKEVAIEFKNLESFGQVGKTVSGTVGEIAKVEVTPIAGGTDPSKPLAVDNEAEPGLKWTALGKTYIIQLLCFSLTQPWRPQDRIRTAEPMNSTSRFTRRPTYLRLTRTATQSRRRVRSSQARRHTSVTLATFK